jgi:hypothetical protein
MGAAFYALLAFVASQLVLIGVAMVRCDSDSTPRGPMSPLPQPNPAPVLV